MKPNDGQSYASFKVESFLNFLINCEDRELATVEDEVWKNLLNVLGKKVINKKITEDGKSLCKVYKNPKSLEVINVNTYIKDRNPLIIAFLEGLSQKEFLSNNNPSNSTKFQFCCLLENIYCMTNLNWVLPMSFLSNLVQSLVSGSKIVSLLNGKLTPGGSYSTYLNWLKEVGNQKLVCPKGDVQTYLDNIGNIL